MDVIAQVFGVAGMVFNIAAYLMKDQRKLILMRLSGSAFFTVNFLMLGAWTGAMMNVVSVLRAAVYADKKRFQTDRPVWLVGFIAVYLLCYVLTFAAFDEKLTPITALVELLPVVGMIAENVGFIGKQAKHARLSALVASPSWLVYNIINFSIGGIICETFSLISVAVGMLRHDLKKEKTV